MREKGREGKGERELGKKKGRKEGEEREEEREEGWCERERERGN